MKGQIANLPATSHADLPERWSAARKSDIVLRLIRGEPSEDLSREIGVALPVLEEWWRLFVTAGRNGLKSRSDPDSERELVRARAKIGELTMRLELLEELLKKRGLAEEPARLER